MTEVLSKFVIDFSKSLLERFRNSKYAWIVVVGFLLFQLNKVSPLSIRILSQSLGKIADIIYDDPLPLIFFFCFITLFALLARHSHKKHLDTEYLCELRSEQYTSDENELLVVKVYENTRRFEPIRRISIFNNSNEELKNAVGYVDFYLHKTRKFRVPFDIRDLKSGYGEVIEEYNIRKYGFDWNEFDVLVQTCNFSSSKISNRRCYGDIFYILPPDHRDLLNRFWFEKYISYDLKWLKRQWSDFVIPYTFHHFKTQTYFERTITKKTYINILRNWLRIIFVTPIYIAILVVSAVLLAKFAHQISEIVRLLTKDLKLAFQIFYNHMM